MKDFRTNEIHFNDLYNIFLDDANENYTENEPGPSQHKKRKTSFNLERQDLHYKQIYAQILDIIIVQLETRFADIGALQYFDLVNYENFGTFSKEFPSNLLQELTKQYSSFDQISLKNELSVLYSDTHLLGESTSVQEMVAFIYKNNLTDCLPQLYKLLCLVLSIPVTSASVERSFSALKRIKTYNRNRMSQDRLSNVSLIAIEKRLVSKLKENNSFYEHIIHHFANMKNRRLPLCYKKL